ncbi:MAG: adenine phosphoribosyltransferase [Patescibacteria group bacterium]|nr:adenine phosphoribosyltransferase [Patescibacteria group bacterium]
MTLKNLKKKVRSIPDWPEKGVVFRDITPVLEDKKLFRFLIEELSKFAKGENPDKIVGIDARGFILASALAYKLKTGLAIVRKKGKLPYKTIKKKYTLEYAAETLEMHRDAIKKGERVLLIDDLLATGGTMKAASEIVKKLGGKIVGILFFIELKGLKGRKKLKGYRVKSLINF